MNTYSLFQVILMAPPQEGQSPWPNFIFLGAIIFIFYFFMIRPQQKKAKEQKKFIDELKKGDRVVTNAGIHGKIVEMNDQTIVIQSLETKLKLEKSAISIDLSKAVAKTSEE